ncbi:MAG: 5'-3' exonuclease H3TH domain-containing protein [Pseudomonadota bacterium]|nr:5'-3' exonuclease H3TH domain-containing protein [Pseudomonadota bacterium]
MTLHVVDGTFEIFRAHFSKRPEHARPDGKPFKATGGLVSSLLALLSDSKEKVTHLAVAFDNPIRSFRNDLFPDYKSDVGIDPDLRAQFDDAEEATRALGIAVWSMDRWEADDALASAAWRWGREVDVRILSPDKDLGQCLAWPGVVQVDRIRERVIDAATLRATRGVEPSSIPDLLGLIGDDADGIPGLPGWGDKSASTVLARWGRIDAIPTIPSAWDVKVRGAEKLCATLNAQRQDALLYRELATLVHDVPLPESLDDLRWRGAPRARFHAWCDTAGLGRLKERPSAWL